MISQRCMKNSIKGNIPFKAALLLWTAMLLTAPSVRAVETDAAFQKDMAYYHKVSAQKNFTANDKLYILRQFRAKYENNADRVKIIDQEMKTAEKPAAKPAAPVKKKAMIPAPAMAAPDGDAVPVDDELPMTNYKIQIGDVLSVSVTPATELSQESLVHSDGDIRMPLIGSVPAKGLTPKQVADKLEKKLSRFVTNPKVGVSLRQFESLQIFTMGEVRNPGPVNYREGMRLLDAVSQAGGFTDRAYRSEVKIYRGKDNSKKIITVNAQEILERGDFVKDFPLKAGDIVEVSAQETNIYIVGMVQKPGYYAYRPGLHLLELVSLASGFSNDANMRKVRVFRVATPQRKVLKVNMKRVMAGATDEDLLLEASDIVFVPQKSLSAGAIFLTTNVLPWLTAAALAVALIL